MANWLHGVCVSARWFVPPQCGFSLSLFGNYHQNSATVGSVLCGSHMSTVTMNRDEVTIAYTRVRVQWERQDMSDPRFKGPVHRGCVLGQPEWFTSWLLLSSGA